MSGDNDLLRHPAAKALLLAALLMSLALGAAFVVVNTPPSTDAGVLRDARPLTNDQARGQVVESARQIVTAARLRGVTGSYAFLSCTNAHDPPYQVALYMNFALPETNSIKRVREIASAMVASGWREAPSMGEHFGLKLTKDGVTSTFHENPHDARFGVMRLYGECRNTADHRNDNPAWRDVSDQLG